MTLKSFKQFLIEALKKLAEWIDNNDNSHLGDSSQDISDKLHEKTAKNDDISSTTANYINDYTRDSSELNHDLVACHRQHVDPKLDADMSNRRGTITHLDKATKHPIGHETHLYSGIGFDPREHLTPSDKGHALLHLPAYTSTTHDKRTAAGFSTPVNSERHILHIHAKPTDHGAHVSPWSHFPQEHETILPRHTTLRVHPTPDTYEGPTVRTGRTVHVWHATIHSQHNPNPTENGD